MHIIQSNTDLREDVLTFMAWRRQGVTFAELVRMLPQLKGTESFLYPGFDTILLWRGVSPDAIAALSALIDEGRLVMTPTSTLTYIFFDRYRSSLPIASARRKYRTLRWWPMTLAIGDEKTGEEAAENTAGEGQQSSANGIDQAASG